MNHLHHDALPVLHVRLFSRGNSRMAIKSNKATGPLSKHGITGANVPGLGYGTADHTDVLTWPPHLSGFPLLPERHLGIRRLECGFHSPLKLCVKAVRVLSVSGTPGSTCDELSHWLSYSWSRQRTDGSQASAPSPSSCCSAPLLSLPIPPLCSAHLISHVPAHLSHHGA